MFEPIRGGTRGGQAEFKWSDVSADKDREVRHRTALYAIVVEVAQPRSAYRTT